MDRKLKALGCHVFAGGFTCGVQQAGWDVDRHLETLGFGLETARQRFGVECINDQDADWPTYRADDYQMMFGNPRCTAFSTVTSGERYVKSNAHGPWAKQTCDVRQFVDYGVHCGFPFLIWESVQQAYHAAGADLVKHLVHDKLVPNGYRVAHLFINAATFGNAQMRKRYFQVAYKRGYRFNVQPPPLAEHYATLFDVIKDTRHVEGRPHKFNQPGYDAECYRQPNENDLAVIAALPTGWCQNTMGKFGYHLMTQKDKDQWDFRRSEMPFGLHSIRRLSFLGPAPTMHSGSRNWVHPELDRGLLVGEFTKIMGWPADCYPIGPSPVSQLCKGIVPAAGEWLARQVQLSIEGHWGQDDWATSFNDQNATWEGGDSSDADEKVIDMTRYVPKRYDASRYADESLRVHRFNVCQRTGKVIKPWRQVAEQNSAHIGGRGDDVRLVG
jgi:site-specific DNA-cytosine methylase